MINNRHVSGSSGGARPLVQTSLSTDSQAAIQAILRKESAVYGEVGTLMTRPSVPGWYDDPNGSANAERYWNGNTWTPERRRKKASQPPPPTAVPPYSPGPVMQYPAAGGPPQFPSAGPPPLPPAFPADIRQKALRLPDIIGIAVAVCGVLMFAMAFMEWGRARFDYSDGVVKLSFPGFGRFKADFDNVLFKGEIPFLKNFAEDTYAGLPAMGIGVLLTAVGLAYWKLNYRLNLAIATVALGLLGLGIFAYQLTDLRNTFGDQGLFSDMDFHAGIGLLGSLLLSISAVGLGVFAFVTERSSSRRSLY
jgi:hypothetical protein